MFPPPMADAISDRYLSMAEPEFAVVAVVLVALLVMASAIEVGSAAAASVVAVVPVSEIMFCASVPNSWERMVLSPVPVALLASFPAKLDKRLPCGALESIPSVGIPVELHPWSSAPPTSAEPESAPLTNEPA